MEQQDNQEKIITIFEPQKQNQTANLLIKYIYIDEDKISQIRVMGKLDKADERELYRQHVFKTDGGVKEEHTCSRAS